MKSIKIKSKIRSFEVCFTDDFLFIDDFKKLSHYMIIVGRVLYTHYKKKIFDRFPQNKLMIIELDEQRKTLATVIKIYDKLLELAAKKNLNLISFGGGINQDVVGFVASTLYRGVNWIFVPTTLLAMTDSAIGLKTSLNFNEYKNVLGTFYPPSKIYININFLDTLSTKDFYSGVGEIIKFYLMKQDPLQTLSHTIKTINKLVSKKYKKHIINIIKESIQIKLHYMEGDEFDQGRRNLLNYGHELGHALESSSSFVIPHGIAVIIGMIFANLIAVKKGLLKQKVFERINNHLLIPNIPKQVIPLRKEFFLPKRLLAYWKKDKKRTSADSLPIVLPTENFTLVKISDLSFQEAQEGIQQLIYILKLSI